MLPTERGRGLESAATFDIDIIPAGARDEAAELDLLRWLLSLPQAEASEEAA